MLTVYEALQLGKRTLATVPDPEVDATALLAQATRMEIMSLRLNARQTLTAEQEERYRSLLLLRAWRQPLQYLLGKQYFYGRPFQVDARVLIPRQETETLCEKALAFLCEAGTAPRALDVCTGSGAVAVTLRLGCPQVRVTATDVSEDALAVARGNARDNGTEIRFLQGDLLLPVRDERFELITCNPPYVKSGDCETLQPEVMREPRLALDGGADGLAFYRRLAADAPACLVLGGRLMVEVGDGQAAEVAALLADSGAFDGVEVYRDLFGMERVVSARRADSPT
ncbi:MAG: peptide chain release factor N(5)-glutamine methyltransferase [Eubacteriales bacterium]|nr:peptide chain release factor N(5)-glutamine methyltransferase [Eubacteriales bacterium]